MKFTITRENLFQGLQFVMGVVERKQSIPILANVLLELSGNQLSLTGTDHEIELKYQLKTASDPSHDAQDGKITLSGRKLMDICRQFPPEAKMVFRLEAHKMLLQVDQKSRFVFATLPAEDFPLMAAMPEEKFSLPLESRMLHQLLATTSFAIAEQDVRYYMNGLFFEVTDETITTVATDGHRMTFCQLPYTENGSPKTSEEDKKTGFILPRKGVLELLRILNAEKPQNLTLRWTQNAVRIETENFGFFSRLIDSNYPDYQRIFPKVLDKTAHIDKEALKQILLRMLVFTTEKFHAARLFFKPDLLSFYSHNTENEEAVDELAIEYAGDEVEIAFNIHYLIAALNVLPDGPVQIRFSESDKSACVVSEKLPCVTHIIMPMSL